MGIQLKAILALSLLLVLSLGGNFLQARHAWVKYGEDKKAAEVEGLKRQVAAFDKKAAVDAALAKAGNEDHEQLVQDLEKIAQGMKQNQSRSRTVTRANPLPANCAPGQARMDSINQTLGPQK